MSRCVQWSLFGGIVLAALIALAGCGHYWYGQRDAWRRDAEVACLQSGAVPETPQRMRISAINGPGICGADFPLRVSALGEAAPLGYEDEPPRPPAAIPNGAMPRWPLAESRAPSPPAANALPQSLPSPPTPRPNQPISLAPPANSARMPSDFGVAPGAPRFYETAPLAPVGAPSAAINPSRPYPPPTYGSPAEPAPLEAEQMRRLGPTRGAATPHTSRQVGKGTGVLAAGPAELRPPATLACPIVAALDQWVAAAVQPAAVRWFGQPVAGIKQISAYSCRGMNGNPNAQISEHAFGNALDVAAFELADGRRISVQYGWHGSPEEQGFLRDVQAAACAQFTTVLAPGANVYHYNHIHVDLMRHASGRRVCEPAAVSGELVAERARARYAAQRYRDAGVTGTIKARSYGHALDYSGPDQRLPLAAPGED